MDTDYKRKRESKDLTMEDVAKKVGISVQAYRLIEKGITKNPRKETKDAIDKALE